LYYNGGVDRDRGGCIEKSGTLKNKRGSGMVPKIKIDREQAEWVEIGTYSYKRIALYEDDASVVCVVGDQEELFKSGEPFRISPWSKKAYTFSFTFTGEKVFPVKPKMRPAYSKEELLALINGFFNDNPKIGNTPTAEVRGLIAQYLADKLQKPVVLREDEIENIILDNEDFPEVAAKEIHAVLAGKIQKPEASPRQHSSGNSGR